MQHERLAGEHCLCQQCAIASLKQVLSNTAYAVLLAQNFPDDDFWEDDDEDYYYYEDEEDDGPTSGRGGGSSSSAHEPPDRGGGSGDDYRPGHIARWLAGDVSEFQPRTAMYASSLPVDASRHAYAQVYTNAKSMLQAARQGRRADRNLAMLALIAAASFGIRILEEQFESLLVNFDCDARLRGKFLATMMANGLQSKLHRVLRFLCKPRVEPPQTPQQPQQQPQTAQTAQTPRVEGEGSVENATRGVPRLNLSQCPPALNGYGVALETAPLTVQVVPAATAEEEEKIEGGESAAASAAAVSRPSEHCYGYFCCVVCAAVSLRACNARQAAAALACVAKLRGEGGFSRTVLAALLRQTTIASFICDLLLRVCIPTSEDEAADILVNQVGSGGEATVWRAVAQQGLRVVADQSALHDLPCFCYGEQCCRRRRMGPNDAYAVKIYPLPSLDQSSDTRDVSRYELAMESMIREFLVTVHADHQAVCCAPGGCSSVCLVGNAQLRLRLPLMRCSAADWRQAAFRMPPDQLLRDACTIMARVVRNVDLLQVAGIVHGDIKMENVLFAWSPANELTILLADFGNASRFGARAGRGVTLGVTAPEMLCEHPVSPYTDVWGLGVLLYQLLVGAPPANYLPHAVAVSVKRRAAAAAMRPRRPEPPPSSPRSSAKRRGQKLPAALSPIAEENEAAPPPPAGDWVHVVLQKFLHRVTKCTQERETRIILCNALGVSLALAQEARNFTTFKALIHSLCEDVNHTTTTTTQALIAAERLCVNYRFHGLFHQILDNQNRS